MVEVNPWCYVDELMKTCAWEELTELKGKPIRDFQFLNWNIFLKAETDFENIGEKISKRYWDTSASSQVSRCQAWDLFESQISMTAEEFELRVSCIQNIYLTH